MRGVSSLPIVALMTFDDGAETLAGVGGGGGRAAGGDGRRRDRREPRRGPHGRARGARRDAGDGKPLAALPNIGLASLAGGRVIYPHATPEYFAEFAAHARELGAKIIGGCCGTTPAEISAIRAAVEEERKPRAPLDFDERELVVSLGEEQRETGLARALREGEWVVSVQLDPPLGGNIGGLVELVAGAEGLRPGRLRRRQRQRQRARRHERDHVLRRDRARDGASRRSRT